MNILSQLLHILSVGKGPDHLIIVHSEPDMLIINQFAVVDDQGQDAEGLHPFHDLEEQAVLDLGELERAEHGIKPVLHIVQEYFVALLVR